MKGGRWKGAREDGRGGWGWKESRGKRSGGREIEGTPKGWFPHVRNPEKMPCHHITAQFNQQNTAHIFYFAKK